MKSIAISVAILSVLGVTAPAIAQQDHTGHHPATEAQVMSDEWTSAVVRKLDMEYGKITLKHETIKQLGMPGMTMVFQVQDKTLLDGLAQGDNVRVKVEKIGSALVVTALEKIPHSGH